MTGGEVHEVSAVIGALREAVDTLKETVKTGREETVREHREVYNIVAATEDAMRVLTREIASLQTTFADFKADFKETKKLAEDYRDTRSEARGAKKLAGLLYTVAGGSAALGLNKLLDVFSTRPPHP